MGKRGLWDSGNVPLLDLDAVYKNEHNPMRSHQTACLWFVSFYVLSFTSTKYNKNTQTITDLRSGLVKRRGIWRKK